MHEAGHGHVGVLAAGICHFLRGRPALLDTRDHLAADRAIGIVFVDQVEKVRGDGHRQLRAGEQHARAFLIGEIDACFEIREGIDAVAELPFGIGPMLHRGVRPVARCVGAEGGFEVAAGSHSRFVRCNRSGGKADGSSEEFG